MENKFIKYWFDILVCLSLVGIVLCLCVQSAQISRCKQDIQKCLDEWSRITGFRAGTLQNRKYAGWSDEKTLTFPLRKHKKYKTNNELKML